MSSSSDSNSLAGETDPSTDTSPVELRTDQIVESVGNSLLKRVDSLLERIAIYFREQPRGLTSEIASGGLAFIRSAVIYKQLEDCVRTGALDDYLSKHEPCRGLVTEIFGSRYPHLNRLDEEEDTRERWGKREKSQIGSGTSPKQPKTKQVAFATERQLTAEELELVHDLLMSQNELQDRHLSRDVNTALQNVPIDLEELSALLNDPTSLQAAGNNAIASSHNKMTSSEMKRAEHLEPSTPPRAHGRAHGRNHGTHHGVNPTASKQVSMSGSRWEPLDSDDDVPGNWSDSKAIKSLEDLKLHHYKGWKIEGPATQLARARNFLADEDVDRTPGWKRKFAELAEYFAHLLDVWDGEDWGADLREAIDMLQTHWNFEDYHYGRPNLVLDFPKVWPRESTRLPQVPGSNITSGERVQPDRVKHKLALPGEVCGAHESQYNIPLEYLEEHYLKRYKSDLLASWNPKAGQKGKGAAKPPEWNMANQENGHFEECMTAGVTGTANVIEKIDPPYDFVEDKDGGLVPGRTSLESFARFRGQKRAALQHCINIFDSSENDAVSNTWSTVVLPDEAEPPKADAGILFQPPTMRNPPKSTARDPLGYTVLTAQYKAQDRYWAEWVKEHAIKRAWGHRKWIAREEPIMGLPPNWKGPLSPNLLDKEMLKTRDALKGYRLLHQKLLRAYKRAPRPFLYEVLVSLGQGLDVNSLCNPTDLNLSFTAFSFNQEKTDQLALLRKGEVECLQYLAQLPDTKPLELEEPLGWRAEILLSRTTALLNDIQPDGLFQDDKEVSLDDFLTAVNEKIGGPVMRHCFTPDNLRVDLPKLFDRNVLECSSNGLLQRHRPKTFPEDIIRYREFGFFNSSRESEPTEAAPGEPGAHDFAGPGEDTQSVRSESTEVTIPESEKEPENYRDLMPRLSVMTAPISDPERAWKNEVQLLMFFRCLAYRFGLTLQVFGGRCDKIPTSLTKERKQANLEQLWNETKFWLDDARDRPEHRHHNPDSRKVARVRTWYSDLVEQADPDNFDPAWQKHQTEIEGPARHFVRKGLLYEAHGNKSLMWPSDIRTIKDANGDKVESLTREPIWTFALPGYKTKAPRFWDINHWPVHLQSPQTQTDTQAGQSKVTSGMESASSTRRLSSGWNAPPDTDLEAAALDEVDVGAPSIRTFADRYHDRETFHPGSGEYWLGDTKLQREYFEQNIRRVFETPKKRTWLERLTESIFGKKKERNPLALPKVDVRRIPKSRPAPLAAEGARRNKRRRLDAIPVYKDIINTGGLPSDDEENEPYSTDKDSDGGDKGKQPLRVPGMQQTSQTHSDQESDQPRGRKRRRSSSESDDHGNGEGRGGERRRYKWKKADAIQETEEAGYAEEPFGPRKAFRSLKYTDDDGNVSESEDASLTESEGSGGISTEHNVNSYEYLGSAQSGKPGRRRSIPIRPRGVDLEMDSEMSPETKK